MKKTVSILLLFFLAFWVEPSFGQDEGSEIPLKKSILKVDLPALMFTNLAMTYERYQQPQKSYEASLTIFIPGSYKQMECDKLSGFMVRLGQKSYPITTHMRNYGIVREQMEGWYWRRELFLIQRTTTYTVEEYSSFPLSNLQRTELKATYHELGFGAILNVGFQSHISKNLFFDIYGGFGFGYKLLNREFEAKRFYSINYNSGNIAGIYMPEAGISSVNQMGIRLGYSF